jgi:methylmalonyl-CoA/ethylmalonyl-CoA epimerase
VRVAIFSGDGHLTGGRIELLAPTADDSPIAAFLKKRGSGLHHICVFVSDLDAKLQELKDARIRLIDETPRIGAEGKRIAFVHPSSMNGVLIELEELPKQRSDKP